MGKKSWKIAFVALVSIVLCVGASNCINQSSMADETEIPGTFFIYMDKEGDSMLAWQNDEGIEYLILMYPVKSYEEKQNEIRPEKYPELPDRAKLKNMSESEKQAYGIPPEPTPTPRRTLPQPYN